MIAVRPFEDRDAPDLADIMREMVAFYGRTLPENGFVAADIIAQSQHVGMAVATWDGQMAGFATYGFLYPVAGLRPFLYLHQLYIGAHARRLGVAQAVMAFLARVCVARGCTWMEWSTGADNTAAQAFYEALGATGSPKMAYEITDEALLRLAATAG